LEIKLISDFKQNLFFNPLYRCRIKSRGYLSNLFLKANCQNFFILLGEGKNYLEYYPQIDSKLKNLKP